MNAINLISSTLALGAMMGISGTHFHQVKTMVENGTMAQIVPVDSPAESTPLDKVKPAPKPVVLAAASLPDTTAPSLKNQQPRMGQRDSAYMEILVAIRDEQKNIRQQVSETNRDMDELTFRVDSHSTQFRPLQTKAGRPRALIVNDNEFSPPTGSNQLLPPKQ